MTNGRCSKCGRQVFWAVMGRTRKRMPLDPTPASIGTIVFGADGMAYVDRNPGRAKFVSHFATCPHANKHRQANTQRRRR